MVVEWRPDDNAVYLTSGNDNLALHRAEYDFCGERGEGQHLDHIGMFSTRRKMWMNGLIFCTITTLIK
jgi:hypothetical protein